MSEETKESLEFEQGPKLYELGFLIAPTLSEDKIPAEVGALTGEIEKAGGRVLSSEMPQMRTLAYTISKLVEHKRTDYNQAYFGWVRFEAVSSSLAQIKEALDKSPTLLRFLIVAVPKVPPQPIKKRVMRKPFKKPEEKKPLMTEEQMDKEIEKLLAGAEIPK